MDMKFTNTFDAISLYNGTTDVAGDHNLSFSGMDTIDYLQNTNSTIFYKDNSRTSPYNLMVSGSNLKSTLQESDWCLEADASKKPFTLIPDGGKTQISGYAATKVRASISPSFIIRRYF